MKLLFERSVPGRSCGVLPECDVPYEDLPEGLLRQTPPRLPELAEIDVTRHYGELARATFGVCSGFYPLGSCTMKYNPRSGEALSALPGFAGVHPLQPEQTVQGCLEAMHLCERYLCEITGMDAVTLQPAAGAHGELCGVLVIKAFHEANGDSARSEVIVPDSAHGTNPATAAMAGYKVVSVPSGEDGCVDLEALKAAVGPKTAGLMLTNPNTLGLFERDILEITRIIHDAGGLVYYDGANLNAVMGVARPGDMGFDVVHLNLHKTFGTPHGGGGPGSGAVGCKSFLSQFLPMPKVVGKEGELSLSYDFADSMGSVKAFYGNFLVSLRALCYIMTLGAAGIREAAQNAVLNANYMRVLLKDEYDVASDRMCMHEFVLTLQRDKKESGVTATDIAKGLIDRGMHPPTMYFPLIVPEALMVEPTETESKETLDQAAAAYIELLRAARADPEALKLAPVTTEVSRLDEVGAARNPRLRYEF